MATLRHHEAPDPSRYRHAIAGVIAIAAVYVYFLIFAEFAFLERLQTILKGGDIRPFMGALGLAGIAGSFAGAKWFDSHRGSTQLGLGFGGCALAAAISLAASNAFVAAVAAVAIGGSLAWTTVVLVLCLRPTVHLGRLGICCGAGTGFAYAICNQPFLFTASPRAQTVVAIIAAVIGVLISFRIRSRHPKVSNSLDYGRLAVAFWLVLFLCLIWLDSAAFFIIQNSPFLRAGTWEGTVELQGNAFVHLCAALLAGVALDRRQPALTLGFAFLALLLACLILGGTGRHFPAGRMLYTAGVSVYSTAFVFYPARSGRPWLAGLLFAVAGWFGSAAGIGMAQALHTIPAIFVYIVAFLAVSIFTARYYWIKYQRLARTSAAGLIAIALAFTLLPQRARSAETADASRGREVYISEGCIHCHSQYVRPGTADTTRWGPPATLTDSMHQNPPLFGNRRQGPDLAMVGTRRTAEWNRLHLIEPRSVTPGSRMPSYAHLFKANDVRGDALVAYLSSLGVEKLPERLEAIQNWTPDTGASTLSTRESGKLFTQLCSGCHGADGEGTGALVAKLSLRPPNFRKDAWRHVSAAEPTLELAKIIKFGQPGTPMAGHEYLSDREILSLARYVQTFRSSTPNDANR
ncbi:MAG: cbb3-type cytochrome c oxidase subunit II [Nibricoccus sp.]